MKTWPQAIRDGAISGSIASAASIAVPSTRHALPGYGIRHPSSVFWAMFYEKYFGRAAEAKEILPSLAGGLGVAAVACLVDYKLTPQRLRPGFENRLSGKSLLMVYGAFGLALAVRGLLSYDERRARRAPPRRLRNDVSSDFI